MILNLTRAQAEAVYTAMCALNNVGGLIVATFRDNEGRGIRVRELAGGTVRVTTDTCGHPSEQERHDNQAAFVTAYNLQTDAEASP